MSRPLSITKLRMLADLFEKHAQRHMMSADRADYWRNQARLIRAILGEKGVFDPDVNAIRIVKRSETKEVQRRLRQSDYFAGVLEQ